MLDVNRVLDDVPPCVNKTAYLVRKLNEAGEPILLTVNGFGNLSIQDEGSYQIFIDLVERLETIESVRKGTKELESEDQRRMPSEIICDF